jgi:hypothetical protein
MNSPNAIKTNDPLRGECEKTMLLPIFIFLMGLSPLFVPVGVTVFDEIDGWLRRRAGRPARQFHRFRP